MELSCHRDAGTLSYFSITCLCQLTEQLSQAGLREQAHMNGDPRWPAVHSSVRWPGQPWTPMDRCGHWPLDLFGAMGKLNQHLT